MQHRIDKRRRAILERLAKDTQPRLTIYWSSDEADMKALVRCVNAGYAEVVPHPSVMGGYVDGVRQPAEAVVITEAGREAIA